MNPEVESKVRSCKELQGKTIFDICASDEFLENLAKYMEAQRADRKAIQASYQAMRKAGGAKGYKLPSHPIDRVIDMTCEAFTMEYIAVIYKSSKRPYAEREYIRQLGNQAYGVTIANIVCKEFPELKEKLFPKANEN